jgi:hypothetical protein
MQDLCGSRKHFFTFCGMSLVPLNWLLLYFLRRIDLATRYGGGWGEAAMCYLSTFLIVLSMITPALSGELFRYRGAAKDGGTLEYVFEAGEQNSPNAVTKEKAAEIAADFMTTFYHVQVGALETQEFRTTPVPFWLVSFSDTIKGPLRQMFFVVLLPDGTVVVPRVEKRL